MGEREGEKEKYVRTSGTTLIFQPAFSQVVCTVEVQEMFLLAVENANAGGVGINININNK